MGSYFYFVFSELVVSGIKKYEIFRIICRKKSIIESFIFIINWILGDFFNYFICY